MTKKSKAGRPRENRKRMTIHVTPSTHDIIKNSVKEEHHLNTIGKVVDVSVSCARTSGKI